MQVVSSNEKTELALSSQLVIVDNDPFLRETLCQQLALEGFCNIIEVGFVANLADMTFRINPDLILLNTQMPDGNSVDICRRLRRNGFSNPIVLLIPKGAEHDIALGLEAGADDYIIKPLRLVELIALIRSKLCQTRTLNNVRLEIGSLCFDPGNKMLFETDSERMQALTEKESTILKFLYLAFPGDVSKAQILSEVWGFQEGVSTHTLETHIYRLRQKMTQLTDEQMVVTTEKGYRLADSIS